VDDWAVLSDGSLALVRGHDYHVDWVRSDGTGASSPKMSFDWKRLSEDDKHRIIDSTRAHLDSAIENGTILEQISRVEIVRRPPDPNAAPPSVAQSGRRTGWRAGGRAARGSETSAT
jgi:hypothetical protein